MSVGNNAWGLLRFDLLSTDMYTNVTPNVMQELGELSKNVSSQGRFWASGGDFVTYTYNSVTDAEYHLWGPLRFVFTTTVVCSNGRQVVVVIDFFTFKKRSTHVVFHMFFGPNTVVANKRP